MKVWWECSREADESWMWSVQHPGVGRSKMSSRWRKVVSSPGLWDKEQKNVQVRSKYFSFLQTPQFHLPFITMSPFPLFVPCYFFLCSSFLTCFFTISPFLMFLCLNKTAFPTPIYKFPPFLGLEPYMPYKVQRHLSTLAFSLPSIPLLHSLP